VGPGFRRDADLGSREAQKKPLTTKDAKVSRRTQLRISRSAAFVFLRASFASFVVKRLLSLLSD